jgi:hypothetical protein
MTLGIVVDPLRERDCTPKALDIKAQGRVSAPWVGRWWWHAVDGQRTARHWQRCASGYYLLLVDFTARLYREGKRALSREVAEILDRLGSTVDHWRARLEKLRQGNFLGRFFATTRARLRAVAERLGLKRVPNLGGCPAS